MGPTGRKGQDLRPGKSLEDLAMNVTCPNCATIYRVDPAKVPEVGVRARCNVCSAVFAVRREAEQARSTPPVAPAPQPVAAATPAPVTPIEPPRPAARPSTGPP